MIKRYTNGSWSEVKYKKYGNKAEEFAEFPVTIKGDGNDLTDYSISGNMSQSGTPTPTTPIQPQETGERTGNLYDYHKSFNNAIVYNEYFDYYLLQLKPNTTYTAYTNCESINLSFGTHRTSYIITPDEDTFSTANGGVDKNNSRQITTKASGIVKVGLRTYDDSSIPIPVYTEQDFSSGNVWLMLAEGAYTNQTMPTHEPYGIKIPISSANTTTNIYLGEVQTTRRIKKLVLTGEENWSSYSGVVYLSNVTDYLKTDSAVAICTHYQPQASVEGVSETTTGHIAFSKGSNFRLCIRDVTYTTGTDFKSYLAQQYANGTPVTVWYVLATETTGIVNEPIRKIGDYADTVSMEQAGVQIPTNRGNTVIDVETTLKPSEMSLTYKTWSEANAKIYQNGAWTDTPTPPVTSVVYGWHVDPSIADSSNAVTYLEDAVGMTPAAMGASTFDYGSWEDAFFMPKPCMVRSNGEVAYYLDPNDYSKKADGTPSDVANPDFDGNAMMEWGKIWYKFAGGEIDGEGYFYVSNEQVDDSYHCWCNYDSKDNITDHFYTAIYNGTGTTKLRSISGVALTSANGNGGTTVTQEVERATANNTTADVEWYTDVWADRLLINALLVLIGKSLNTQATFGRGLDIGDQTAKEAYITGTLNDKGLFWGVTTDGNSAVKVFGMENWWGCAWRRTAGCVSIDRALKIKLTYGTADGSTVVGYNQTGDGYISDGTIPSSGGYVKAMVYNQYGYAPNNASGGSLSTYYADYFSQNTGINYLLVGGSSSNGFAAGAFYFNMYNEYSTVSWNRAASLSFKPLAE